MEKKEPKINRETASAEFDRFLDSMGIFVDADDLDPEELSSFKKHKTKIVRSIMDGNLIINDDGEAVYTPVNPKSNYSDPITFHERTGADLMAMDRKKKNHDVARTYSVMGAMCKIPPKVFAGLAGIDIKVCESIFVLLMD